MAFIEGIAAGHSRLLAQPDIGYVKGMDEEDTRTLVRLMHVWADKYPRNRLRSLYYDGKEP